MEAFLVARDKFIAIFYQKNFSCTVLTVLVIKSLDPDPDPF
jgi:hypothetical protein